MMPGRKLYVYGEEAPNKEDFALLEKLFVRLADAPSAHGHQEGDREIVEVGAQRRDPAYPDIMRKVIAERFADTGGRLALRFTITSTRLYPATAMRIHEILDVERQGTDVWAARHLFATLPEGVPETHPDLQRMRDYMPAEEDEFMYVRGYDCIEWLNKLALITNAP